MENNEQIGKIAPNNIYETLDKKNQKLLSFLMRDAKSTYSDLSKYLKISKSNIKRRISILEKKGLITGYHAFIDASKLGLKYYALFIKTNCTTDQKESYIKEIIKMPSVYSLVELTGKYDLLIAFYYKEEKEKNRLIEELLLSEIIKDFSGFDFITYFPILDYTSELFSKNLKTILKDKLLEDKKDNKKIDQKDIEIIKLLSKNCRISNVDIGEKLNISREIVSYRIKKILEKGIIAKFQPTINLFFLGFEGYILMLKLIKPTKKQEIISYLDRTQRCNTILKTQGLWDIISFIHFRNNKEFREFENKFLSEFRGSIHEYSFEIIKYQYKLDWFPIELMK